ncbi:MAG: hypothetical protein IJM98_03910 [Oscillospiraceae bacterium]|nr:hypothetical protein [Oscillospiraceae bacterium]
MSYCYSYKLNNSYTVYVYPSYINDCVEASRKKLKEEKHSYINSANGDAFIPLSVNTRLEHKTFGLGKVVSTSETGIMQVKFEDKTVKFVFPDALKKGLLRLA